MRPSTRSFARLATNDKDSRDHDLEPASYSVPEAISISPGSQRLERVAHTPQRLVPLHEEVTPGAKGSMRDSDCKRDYVEEFRTYAVKHELFVDDPHMGLPPGVFERLKDKAAREYRSFCIKITNHRLQDHLEEWIAKIVSEIKPEKDGRLRMTPKHFEAMSACVDAFLETHESDRGQSDGVFKQSVQARCARQQAQTPSRKDHRSGIEDQPIQRQKQDRAAKPQSHAMASDTMRSPRGTVSIGQKASSDAVQEEQDRVPQGEQARTRQSGHDDQDLSTTPDTNYNTSTIEINSTNASSHSSHRTYHRCEKRKFEEFREPNFQEKDDGWPPKHDRPDQTDRFHSTTTLCRSSIPSQSPSIKKIPSTQLINGSFGSVDGRLTNDKKESPASVHITDQSLSSKRKKVDTDRQENSRDLRPLNRDDNDDDDNDDNDDDDDDDWTDTLTLGEQDRLNDHTLVTCMQLICDPRRYAVVHPRWMKVDDYTVKPVEGIHHGVENVVLPFWKCEHWILVLANLQLAKIKVFNSYRQIDLNSEDTEHIQRLLTAIRAQMCAQSVTKWVVNDIECVQQTNSWDCGVHTIVNCFHDVHRLEKPTCINAKFWRQFLMCMLTPRRSLPATRELQIQATTNALENTVPMLKEVPESSMLADGQHYLEGFAGTYKYLTTIRGVLRDMKHPVQYMETSVTSLQVEMHERDAAIQQLADFILSAHAILKATTQKQVKELQNTNSLAEKRMDAQRNAQRRLRRAFRRIEADQNIESLYESLSRILKRQYYQHSVTTNEIISCLMAQKDRIDAQIMDIKRTTEEIAVILVRNNS